MLLRSRDRTGNVGNLVPAGGVLTEDLLDVPGAEFIFQRNNTGTAPDAPISNEAQRKTDNYIPTEWTDNPQGVDVSNKYEYVSSRTGSSGRWSEFGPPGLYDIFIVEGITGAQFIFRRTSTASAPNAPLSNSSNRTNDDYIPSNWTRDPQGVTSTLLYEWASYRLGISGNWSIFYPPTLRQASLLARGPIPFFRAISGSRWSTSQANLATTGNNVTGDRVTLYNSTSNWTATRVWSGSRWTTIGKWIDGNLIVEGTVLSIFDIIAGAAMKSSNYRAGSAGWRVAQDGGAEFDAAAIRGKLTANQIKAGIIPSNFSDLEGQIGSADIAAGAIIAGKIAANSITANIISNTTGILRNIIVLADAVSDSGGIGLAQKVFVGLEISANLTTITFRRSFSYLYSDDGGG